MILLDIIGLYNVGFLFQSTSDMIVLLIINCKGEVYILSPYKNCHNSILMASKYVLFALFYFFKNIFKK